MNISPTQLLLRLTIYYVAVFGAVLLLLSTESPALTYLPFGGHDALENTAIEISAESFSIGANNAEDAHPRFSGGDTRTILLFLTTTLLATLVVMLPIVWTYAATRFDSGPSKVFVQALLLMPVCATSVVLLIQDSLALAFGLAALVAAVRFRVSLAEAIDGVYIFAAIAVGLAGGVGHMGVALVMAMIFTFTNAILWQLDYGRNPIDEARKTAKAEKLAAKRAKT